MANHFNNLGFDFDRLETFEEFATSAASRGRLVPTSIGGAYSCVSTEEGIELWIQVSPDEQIIGCHPHFIGSSQYMPDRGFLVEITRIISIEEAPLDGRLFGTMVDEGAFGCPIVFDVPDFRQHASLLTLPARVKVQLAAMPYQLHVAADEAAFRADQSAKMGTTGLNAEAFIPCGAFKPGGEAIEPPIAQAILSGRILASERRTNSLSGQPFHALTVRTLGGVLDVAVAPSLLTSEPILGGIVFGVFWLSGRLPSPLTPPPLPTTQATPPPLPRFSAPPPSLPKPAPETKSTPNPAFKNDEISQEMKRRFGAFLRSPDFDAYFNRLHPVSRPVLAAAGLLLPLILQGQAARSAWSKLANGDAASAALRLRYARLAEVGEVVFTYVLICNETLKRQPGVTAPALVIGNFNADRDEWALMGLRDKLADLSLGLDIRPGDREVAKLLRDQNYRFQRRRQLPASYTNGVQITAFDLMIIGDFLPNETLQCEMIPCLAEPGRRGLIAMIPYFLIEAVLKERADPQRG